MAHEVLIRHWLLLRQWLGVNRDLLRQKRKIEGVAEEWRDKGKSKDYLLQGKPLKEAKDFQKQQGEKVALSILAGEFIQKSSKQQRNNRFKLVGFGLIVPLGLAIWLGIVAEKQFRIRQLWQTVEAAKGKTDSYTRIQALQELVKAKENLDHIILNDANLYSAYLDDAELNGANLNGAEFNNANLSGVTLNGANLKNADLADAMNLTPAQIKSACNWQQAIYKVNQNGKIDEKANQEFIKELKGNVASDPKQRVDCSKWK